MTDITVPGPTGPIEVTGGGASASGLFGATVLVILIGLALYKGTADRVIGELIDDFIGKTAKPGLGSWLFAVVVLLFLRKAPVIGPIVSAFMPAIFIGFLILMHDKNPKVYSNLQTAISKLLGR